MNILRRVWVETFLLLNLSWLCELLIWFTVSPISARALERHLNKVPYLPLYSILSNTFRFTRLFLKKKKKKVPSDWLGATWSSAGSAPWLLYVCWLIKSPLSLLYWKLFPAFPSIFPQFYKYRVGKYSTDCISAMLPLVVVTRRVAMDTSFRHDASFPNSTNLIAPAPNLIYGIVVKQ